MLTRERRRLGILVLVTLAIPIVPFLALGELPGELWLEGERSAFEQGAIGAGLLAADVFLPIPSSVIGAYLGYRLGVGLGFLWCWAGLVAGNLLGFAAGRWALRRVGVMLPPTRTAVTLFLTRPVPVLAEAVAIAAGAGGISLWTFVVAALAGNAVYAAALAGSGAALVSETWAGAGLVLPMALPVLGAWLLGRWRRRS